jgi:hypothetical protein
MLFVWVVVTVAADVVFVAAGLLRIVFWLAWWSIGLPGARALCNGSDTDLGNGGGLELRRFGAADAFEFRCPVR